MMKNKGKRILSVSRRTDIPAYYADWLVGRMKKGFTVYPNPVSGKPVFISLEPKHVKILVFWTRNPGPLIPYLNFIDQRYYHYMHLTINGLPKLLEYRNPPIDRIIDLVKQLSKRYGKNYVQWRFDPIILSTVTPEDFILRRFEYIAYQLKGYVQNCYISFVDMYKKTDCNFNRIQKKHRIKFFQPSPEEELEITRKIAGIAKMYGMTVNACAEKQLTAIQNVKVAQCINKDLINTICDTPLKRFQIQKSRKGCRCIKAPDIGYYDSCPHGCIYCYSNKTPEIAQRNAKKFIKDGFPLDHLEKPSKKPDNQMALF